MKFNVLNNSIYHQYMQNITAPIAEGKSLKNAYAKHDPNLEGEYLFKIPLFYDMPSNDTPSPDNDDKYNATVIIKNIANTTEVEGEQGKTENPNKPKTEENSKYQYVEDKDVTYPIYAVVNVQSVLRFRDNPGISGTNVIGTIENDKTIKVIEKGIEKDRICLA